MWDDQAELFSERYTVIRYDLRGFGQSSLPDGRPYSHAEDLHWLLEALGIREPILVGLSMGGGAVVNFAVLHPGIPRAIVVADSSLGGFLYSDEIATEGELLVLTANKKGLDPAKALLLKEGFFVDAMRNKRVAKKLKEIVGSYSGYHWLHRDNGRPLTPPAIARLEQIAVPALVLVGENDVPDFHAIAETLAVKIPNARKIIMAGVGHMCNMEDPEGFNEVVMRFLKEGEGYKRTNGQ